MADKFVNDGVLRYRPSVAEEFWVVVQKRRRPTGPLQPLKSPDCGGFEEKVALLCFMSPTPPTAGPTSTETVPAVPSHTAEGPRRPCWEVFDTENLRSRALVSNHCQECVLIAPRSLAAVLLLTDRRPGSGLGIGGP